jgi:hypothetical protein
MTMNDRDPATHSWHLDKRIPVALILTFGITLAGQTGAALWWAATTSGRLTAVENSVQNSVTSRLNRIEDKLDRLMETSFSASHPR